MLRVEAARPGQLGDKIMKYQIAYLAMALVALTAKMS